MENKNIPTWEEMLEGLVIDMEQEVEVKNM